MTATAARSEQLVLDAVHREHVTIAHGQPQPRAALAAGPVANVAARHGQRDLMKLFEVELISV